MFLAICVLPDPEAPVRSMGLRVTFDTVAISDSNFLNFSSLVSMPRLIALILESKPFCLNEE